MKKIIGVSLVVILVLVVSTVYADVVHLKSGGKMEGKIIKEEKNRTTLKTDYGTVGLKRGDILSIERKPYIFKKQKNKKKVSPAKPEFLREKPAKKRKITLDTLVGVCFTNAPMKHVFDWLSKMTQKKVRYEGDIEELGGITMRANNISIKEVIDRIAQEKELNYEIKKDSIIFTDQYQ